MEFTQEEKIVLIWSLKAIAESDGPRNSKENWKLADISLRIDFDVDKLLIISNMLKFNQVISVLEKCPEEKKVEIRKLMAEMAVVDGEVNEAELKILDSFFVILHSIKK